MPVQHIMIDGQISGILTCPGDMTTAQETQLPAVLMLHGFGTGKNEIDGFYQKMATKLAENNVISLRIDFRGYGDSKGSTQDFSIHDMVSDAIKAFHQLTATQSVDKNRLGVIGFSLGAAVALLLSQQTTFQSLALISPALNLTKDFGSFLGAEILLQLASCEDFIEISLPWRKINISRAFFESLSTCDTNTAAAQFSGNLLCIAGDKDFSAANARAIVNASASPKKAIKIIPAADHVFNIGGLPTVISDVGLWMSFFLSDKQPETTGATNGKQLR